MCWQALNCKLHTADAMSPPSMKPKILNLFTAQSVTLSPIAKSMPDLKPQAELENKQPDQNHRKKQYKGFLHITTFQVQGGIAGELGLHHS